MISIDNLFQDTTCKLHPFSNLWPVSCELLMDCFRKTDIVIDDNIIAFLTREIEEKIYYAD